MNRDFKGVWIPKGIYLSKELTLIEKLILTEISSLDSNKGCFATNAHFAEFTQLSVTHCSKIISKLAEKKYLKVTMLRSGKVVVKRIIKLTKKAKDLRI